MSALPRPRRLRGRLDLAVTAAVTATLLGTLAALETAPARALLDTADLTPAPAHFLQLEVVDHQQVDRFVSGDGQVAYDALLVSRLSDTAEVRVTTFVESDDGGRTAVREAVHTLAPGDSRRVRVLAAVDCRARTTVGVRAQPVAGDAVPAEVFLRSVPVTDDQTGQVTCSAP